MNRMHSSWDLYDTLISGIPNDLTVDECIIGLHWTLIRAGNRAGIAMTFRGSSISGLANGPVNGKTLKEVASGVKSWDMLQASMGMAACNAWYNNREKLSLLGMNLSGNQAGSGDSIFNEPVDSLVGKNVAVIGHFPYIEKQLGDKCNLSVLERDPDGTDYLDSACEYILPEQDFVYITGMTLTNKTLPRLLALCKNAKTTLVGPSSPITPTLFEYGVDCIAGFSITDIDMARALVSQAAHTEIFRCGRRITFSRIGIT